MPKENRRTKMYSQRMREIQVLVCRLGYFGKKGRQVEILRDKRIGSLSTKSLL